tara:strand:- start:352 stop:762 length:411 start_codon:yes stop_codon:yes gene_type:complete
MPAHSETFPWPSYYGHFNYFETQINNHGKVTALTAQGGGVYELTRTQGDMLRVFICECYAFGVAEYMETVENIGEIDAVIINSAWCGYTPDAKFHCRQSKVGLFKIGELIGALHSRDHWSYLTQEQEEYFEEQGWL